MKQSSTPSRGRDWLIQPLIRALRLGLIIILFAARPKQAIRNMLSHAGTEARIQGLPSVFLRLLDRLRHSYALRHQSRNRRGQCATGAMINSRQARPAIIADDPAL